MGFAYQEKSLNTHISKGDISKSTYTCSENNLLQLDYEKIVWDNNNNNNNNNIIHMKQLISHPILFSTKFCFPIHTLQGLYIINVSEFRLKFEIYLF